MKNPPSHHEPDAADGERLHGAFVRSRLPHANLLKVDVTAAARAAGVVRVFTGAEINAITNPMPPLVLQGGLYTPLFKAMSDRRVRHVGDPVALVVAVSRHLAEAAAGLVMVEYEPIVPVTSIDEALDPRSEALWTKADGNTLLDDGTAGLDPIDLRSEDADRGITRTFSGPPQPPPVAGLRRATADVDPETGHVTVHSTSPAPHLLAWVLAAVLIDRSGGRSLWSFLRDRDRRRAVLDRAATVPIEPATVAARAKAGLLGQLGRDRSFLRHVVRMAAGLVSTRNRPTVRSIGRAAGPGSRRAVLREEIALVAAARMLGRSVGWAEDREEEPVLAPDPIEISTISVAADKDGTLRTVRADVVHDGGAYPTFPVGEPMSDRSWAPYRWGEVGDRLSVRTRIVTTNRADTGSGRRRSAGETWARERMLDEVAAELGLNPAEVRLRNLPDEDATRPARRVLLRAVELLDMERFERDRDEAATRGHRLGLGLALHAEAPPDDGAVVAPDRELFGHQATRVAIERDGAIVVSTSRVPSSGADPDAGTRVAAEELGVPADEIEYVWGDTDRTPFGLPELEPTGDPLTEATAAVQRTANAVRRQVIEVAADMLATPVADVRIVDGRLRAADDPQQELTFRAVAEATAELRGLDTGPVFQAVEHSGLAGHSGDRSDGGSTLAVHAVVVDLDLDTGAITIPRYLVVHDGGPLEDPAAGEATLREAVAAALGAVLDERGLTATSDPGPIDPGRIRIPTLEFVHLGDGPGGTAGARIGAMPAVANAVADALGRSTDGDQRRARAATRAGDLMEPTSGR